MTETHLNEDVSQPRCGGQRIGDFPVKLKVLIALSHSVLSLTELSPEQFPCIHLTSQSNKNHPSADFTYP